MQAGEERFDRGDDLVDGEVGSFAFTTGFGIEMGKYCEIVVIDRGADRIHRIPHTLFCGGRDERSDPESNSMVEFSAVRLGSNVFRNAKNLVMNMTRSGKDPP